MTKEEFDSLPDDLKVKELKVYVYDMLAQKQFAEREIEGTNQKIVALMQSKNTCSLPEVIDEKSHDNY